METLGRPGDPHVRQPLQQLLEGHPGLEPGQARPQTEVGRPAEGEMAIRSTPHLESVGYVDGALVAIGRREQQEGPRPGGLPKQYTEGTLTLEFFVRSTKQAAWVGWASKRLSKSSGNRQEVIEKAVTRILTDFPSAS